MCGVGSADGGPGTSALHHEAMAYRGSDQFAATSVPALREGLEREDRLILLAHQTKLDAVRDELGDDADEVAMVATDEHGRNPVRIMTLIHHFSLAGAGRRSLGVNEMLVGASPAILAEAMLTDSAWNAQALASWPLSVLCLYDELALAPDVRDSVKRHHVRVGGRSTGDDFDAGSLQALFATPLDPPPGVAERVEVAEGQLARVRDIVRDAARREGVDPDRIDDLVLAANEMVTNSLRYSGSRCELRMWSDGGTVYCEVGDTGRLADPFVGRLSPTPDASTGRGLWLANLLCDLVQVRSTPDGVVVRLTVEP